MGADTRSVAEIIDDDAAEMAKLGFTAKQVASAMRAITETAKAGLGNWVRIDDLRQAVVDEARGFSICPWPHPGRYVKRVTTVERLDTGETIRWSDLNIHLIAAHGFFEGKGSPYRIEPAKLIALIL